MSPDSPNALPDEMADAEPKAELANAPFTLIVLFALLVYWGMVYFDAHGGGFNPKVYEPYISLAVVADAQPVEGEGPKLIKEGGIIYSHTCVACHQDSGMGSSANGCPPLVNSDWVVGGGPNRIIRLVLYGGQGPISVLGQQYPGAIPMTPWKETLSDHDIAAVLSYVRNAWGNKADYVKPEKVTEIYNKEKTAGFTGYRNATELLKYPDKD